MSSVEFAGWIAYTQVEAAEAEARRKAEEEQRGENPG